MRVEGLEHVNIVAADIGRTVQFYESLLGLEARVIPVMPDSPGRWLYDESGNAILHLQAHNPDRHGPLDAARTDTGAVDHVALACAGYDETVRRCQAMGVAYRTTNLPNADFRQVFVHDPDHVLLELNFRGG